MENIETKERYKARYNKNKKTSEENNGKTDSF